MNINEEKLAFNGREIRKGIWKKSHFLCLEDLCLILGLEYENEIIDLARNDKMSTYLKDFMVVEDRCYSKPFILVEIALGWCFHKGANNYIGFELYKIITNYHLYRFRILWDEEVSLLRKGLDCQDQMISTLEKQVSNLDELADLYKNYLKALPSYFRPDIKFD